jgi:hypothetical protein
MAIIQDTETTEEETQQGLDQPKLGGEQTADLSQGVTAGGAQTSGPSADQRGTTQGSRLSNLKKYVEANRGAGMAQKIQSGMEDIRSGVESGISQAQTGLQEQSAAEKVRLTKGEELIKASQEGGAGLFEAGRSQAFTQDISPAPAVQAEQVPVSGTLTGTDNIQALQQPQPEIPARPDFSQYGQTAQDRMAEFQRYKAGERADLAIQNEQKLAQDIEALQKRAGLAQTEAGRFQLLREQFGRPGYTTGQQRLDQLILQAAPEESQALREMATTMADPVQQQLVQLQAQRDTEQGLVNTQAQQLAAGIATGLFGEAGQPVIDPQTGQVIDVGGALGEFRTGLEGRVGSERERIAQQFGAIQDIVERGYDITPQLLADVGVTDPEQQQQFMDYYQRGQGRTLSSAIEQGGFDIDELREIAAKTGTDYQQMKELYTGQPKTLQDFSASVGKDYASASPENKAIIEQEYENYKTNLANASAEYRANLEGFVGEQLGDLRVKGPEIDFSQYLRGLDPEQVTAARVASQEDFARQAALEQLAGLGFGPLQAGQIGQAGTVGELGYGGFDIGAALGAARQQYELPTYDEYGRVTAQTWGPDSTIGERTQNATERITGDISQGLTDPMQEYTGTGEIFQSTTYDPTKATVDQSMKALTTTASDVETGFGRTMEGDVGGLAQIMTAGGAGSIEGAAAPAVGIEKAVTGGERVEGLSEDYAEALRAVSYGDFSASGEAIKSTYKLPEQMTRDATKKVENIVSEAGTAVSNSWSAAKKAAGSFFCTHIYDLGLVSLREYLKLNKFLNEIKYDYAEFLSWYIDNGEKIIELVGDFDWSIGKAEIFDNLLEKYEAGDIEGAVRCYGEFTRKLCDISGVEFHDSHYNTENADKYLEKVLDFYGE